MRCGHEIWADTCRTLKYIQYYRVLKIGLVKAPYLVNTTFESRNKDVLSRNKDVLSRKNDFLFRYSDFLLFYNILILHHEAFVRNRI